MSKVSKVKQAIILAVVLALLLTAAGLASVIAQNALKSYFYNSNGDFMGSAYNSWMNSNTLAYMLVGFAEFWAAFPFLMWCRRTKDDRFDRRKRKFTQMAGVAIACNIVILVISSILISFLNPVFNGASVVVSNILYLAIVSVVMLVCLLFLLVIKPIANAIQF